MIIPEGMDELAEQMGIESAERLQHLIIYIVGTLDKFKVLGLIEGGVIQLGDEGAEIREELVASKFEDTITTDEIDKVMSFLFQMSAQIMEN